jgi:hypothetical protein
VWRFFRLWFPNRCAVSHQLGPFESKRKYSRPQLHVAGRTHSRIVRFLIILRALVCDAAQRSRDEPSQIMRLKICDHAFHLGRWNADLLAYVATAIQPVVRPMPQWTHRYWLTEYSDADLPPPLTGRTSHLILVNDILKVYQFAQTATLVYEKVVFISLSLHAGSNRTHLLIKKEKSHVHSQDHRVECRIA